MLLYGREMFDTLPSEIIHNIVWRLPYGDIVNLCNIDERVRDICRDDEYFWRNKLDYDYTWIMQNGKLIPSEYVAWYKLCNESWRMINERWVNMMFIHTHPLSTFHIS